MSAGLNKGDVIVVQQIRYSLIIFYKFDRIVLLDYGLMAVAK